jgi:hypothetical protein
VPLLKSGAEIQVRDSEIYRFFKIDEGLAGMRREFERRLMDAFFLVRTTKVPVFRALHELLSDPNRERNRIWHKNRSQSSTR